mmetsp:Transcript_14607/g.18060  ORF Transcript_14607/g.18060 Transcript_14607/m.18060 type:complete len:181 (-) Transcript_14607:5-547(-)
MYAVDCTNKTQLLRLKFVVESYFPVIHVLVLSTESFTTDIYDRFSSATEAKLFLEKSNVISKSQTLESLIRLICPFTRFRRKAEDDEDLVIEIVKQDKNTIPLDHKTDVFCISTGAVDSKLLQEEAPDSSKIKAAYMKSVKRLRSWFEEFVKSRREQLQSNGIKFDGVQAFFLESPRRGI